MKTGVAALMLAIVSFVLLVGSFYLVVDRREKLINGYADLAQIAIERGAHGELEQLVNRTVEQREQLDRYFVDEPGISIFLSNLEKWSKGIGVEFEVTKAELASEGAPRLLLELEASGAKSRLSRLLNLLDNLPYLVVVNAVKLREQSSTNWSADLKLELLSLEKNV